jgi:hypothetical protein
MSNITTLRRPTATVLDAGKRTVTIDAELFHSLVRTLADLVEPRAPQEPTLDRDGCLLLVARLSLIVAFVA